jgi:hypothetical protein
LPRKLEAGKHKKILNSSAINAGGAELIDGQKLR